eukprot:3016866-Amphidinium_carterae.1
MESCFLYARMIATLDRTSWSCASSNTWVWVSSALIGHADKRLAATPLSKQHHDIGKAQQTKTDNQDSEREVGRERHTHTE